MKLERGAGQEQDQQGLVAMERISDFILSAMKPQGRVLSVGSGTGEESDLIYVFKRSFWP